MGFEEFVESKTDMPSRPNGAKPFASLCAQAIGISAEKARPSRPNGAKPFASLCIQAIGISAEKARG